MEKADYEVVPFSTKETWRQWLQDNHMHSNGIWLKLYKKASGVPSLNYTEALDEALCYGWIDGQVKKGDTVFYVQKFTPRRPGSLWSKRNIEHVTRLQKDGLMMPAGLVQVNQAKEDGRWAAAYDAPSTMTVPDYFVKKLNKHPAAKTFFATLNKANVYAIAWRLRTAKTEETRRRRQEKIIDLLKDGKPLH